MTNDQTGIMASNQAGINDYSVMGDNEDLTQRRRDAERQC